MRTIIDQIADAIRGCDPGAGATYEQSAAAALNAALGAMRSPIQTAPIDGTFVMLFGGTTNEEFSQPPRLEPCQSRPVIGCYVPGWIWQDTAGKSHEGCWAYAFWDDGWYSIYEHPTHWAPLDGEWKRPEVDFE